MVKKQPTILPVNSKMKMTVPKPISKSTKTSYSRAQSVIRDQTVQSPFQVKQQIQTKNAKRPTPVRPVMPPMPPVRRPVLPPQPPPIASYDGYLQPPMPPVRVPVRPTDPVAPPKTAPVYF